MGAQISHYYFVSGDSYTATGFNTTAQPQPSLQYPLGNPPYPGVTYSGGANWIDVLVNNASSYTVGYNYAVASNTVNASRTQQDSASIPSPIADFIDQVSEFETLVSTISVPWNGTNSLFINWFGTNDIHYNGIFTSRTFAEAMPYLQADVGDYFGQLGRLYSLGARKFLTILEHPMYRSPVVIASGKQEQAKNLTDFWNDQIRMQHMQFQAQFPDAKSELFDPAPTFNYVLDNWADFGAPNNSCISYPDGTPCLWHDFIHAGLVIHERLGKAVSQSIEDLKFFQ